MRPPEKPYDFSRSRPLQQEQSKLSLAEVYEQEYIKQTQVGGGDTGGGRGEETQVGGWGGEDTLSVPMFACAQICGLKHTHTQMYYWC